VNANNVTAGDRKVFVEDLAAELTEAAYPVALRHGTPASWIDLELDLWRTLVDKVKDRPQLGCA